MKIEVTVHLKSGGEIVSGYYGETIQSIAESHVKVFTDKEVLLINDEKNIQLIPRDNIAIISVKEVTE